jgi:hypothetical protein
METLDTSVTLHRIAARMRAEAQQTSQPDYQRLMLRAAASFEAEAERLFEDRFAALLSQPAGNLH